MEEPSSLYDVLGVSEDASSAHITAAYRRLSRTYHPDRWLEEGDKQQAGQRWLHISSAYDVLADERKRMAYDTLGPDQYALGLSVLSDRIRGPDELRAAVKKHTRREAENEHQAKLRLSGATIVSTAIDDLAPSPPDGPRWTRWLGPDVQSVAMTQDMTLELGRRCTLSIGPQLLTKSGLGGSTLRLGFKRQLSAFASVEANATLLSQPGGLGVSASRRLSRHSQGSASVSLTPSLHEPPQRWPTSLALKASRQITARALGEATLNLGATLAASSITYRLTRNAAKRKGAPPPKPPPPSTDAATVDADGDEDGGVAAAAEEGSASAGAAAAAAASGPLARLSSAAARLGGAARRAARRSAARARRLCARVLPPLRLLLLRRKPRRLGQTSGELTLQPQSGLRWGGSVGWRHSSRSRSKLAFHFGVGSLRDLVLSRAFSVSVSTDRVLSAASGSSFGVALQISNRGVTLKLKLQRHAQRLQMPVFVAAVATAPLLLFAVIDSALELPPRSKRSLRGFTAIRATPAGGATAGSAQLAAFEPRLWVRYQLGVEVRTVVVGDEEPLRIGMLSTAA